MLGVPRTVIPPTDQIQGHVGQWRNGFFVNDIWQATREPDPQPRPALRDEHPGADLCRAGVDARHRLRDDHPEQFPGRGLPVHRAELQGHRAATRRDLSPGREDGVAGRLRDLLQPEPDELVHVPDQQPADRRGHDLHQRSGQPDAVVHQSVGRRRPDHPAGHDLADARPAERAQEPVELRRPARSRPGHGARPAVPRLAHRSPRPQLLQQHAAAGRRQRRRAPAQPALSQPPHHRERSGRRLRRGQRDPAQEDVAAVCRPTSTTPGRGRGTRRRTRTAAAR